MSHMKGVFLFNKLNGTKMITTAQQVRQAALQTFKTMQVRAQQYVNSHDVNLGCAEPATSDFNPRDGICYNIPRCFNDNCQVDVSSVALVKDNIIRQVPSFSGAYHYPVPHPMHLAGTPQARRWAEEAWDEGGDRWVGEYGKLRMQQLEELIDFVENKWSDTWATNMSPANRLGIIENETIVSKDDDPSELWIMTRDDDTSDPYFEPVGRVGEGFRRCIDLGTVTLVSSSNTEKLTVGKYKSEKAKIDKRVARLRLAKGKLEAQLEAINTALGRELQQEAFLNMSLTKHHGLKFA